MIVFNFDILDQFLGALACRATPFVFTQYVEPHTAEGVPVTTHKLMLQFMGRPDPQSPQLMVLHQCVLKIQAKKERDEIIASMKGAFDTNGIKLIQGYINEIFMSIS